MSEVPIYKEFHPRWYRRRVSTWWWMKRGAYLAFITREVSSAFIAWFIVFTLMQVSALRQGEEAWVAFLAWARHPLVVILNVVCFFFVVFHAVTWFNLAPKAMVIRFRGQRVRPMWIALANYGAWVVVSVVLAWFILGG